MGLSPPLSPSICRRSTPQPQRPAAPFGLASLSEANGLGEGRPLRSPSGCLPPSAQKVPCSLGPFPTNPCPVRRMETPPSSGMRLPSPAVKWGSRHHEQTFKMKRTRL